jgi:hypothetical protein
MFTCPVFTRALLKRSLTSFDSFNRTLGKALFTRSLFTQAPFNRSFGKALFIQVLLIRTSFKRMIQTQVICYCEFVALGGRGSAGEV